MAGKKQTPARNLGEQSDTESQGAADAAQTTAALSGDSNQAPLVEASPQQATIIGNVGDAASELLIDNPEAAPGVLASAQPSRSPSQGGSIAGGTVVESSAPSTADADAGESVTEVPDLSPALTPSAPTAADAGSEVPPGEEFSGVEQPAAANPNPATLLIYPLRSYMDEGELRRRAGPGYSAPRRHAEQLVQKGLASLEPIEE